MQDPSQVRNYLLERKAVCKGIDHQTDTYFNVPNGRLKLREGNIENNLIYYQRPDQAGPKQSDFSLVPIPDPANLKEILTISLGVKVIVQKAREIYFLDNVKFHIDTFERLGNFVEIEASNKNADLSTGKLREQCNYYLRHFGIKEEDLVEKSYSDMLMAIL